MSINQIAEKELSVLQNNAKLMVYNFSHNDIEQVKNWVTLTSQLSDVNYVKVVSENRIITASSSLAHEGKPLLDVDSKAFNFIDVSEPYLFIDNHLLIKAPVFQAGSNIETHYLLLEKNISQELKRLKSKVLIMVLLVATIFLIFAFIYGFKFNIELKSKLTSFQRAITQFNDGDGNTRLVENKRHLFYPLACTLNDSFSLNEFRNQQLEEKINFVNLVESLANEAIIETRRDGQILSVNKAALAMFGYHSVNDLVGANVSILIPPKYQKAHQEKMHKSNTVNTIVSKIRYVEGIRADGTCFPVEIIIAQYDIPSCDNYVAFIRDRSDEEQSQAAIEKLAYLDNLTGLRNLNGLKKQLTQTTYPLHICIIELLYLRELNDIHGQKFGDEYLLQFAHVLSKLNLKNLLCARLETSKFIITHTETSKEENKQFRSIKDYPLVVNSIPIKIQFNRSIALLNKLDELDALLERFQLSLRSVQGKVNVVTQIDEQFNQRLKRESLLKRGLVSAIENNALYFLYQPKFDTNTLKANSAEALIRWQYEGEFISPAEFIPLAEKHGLMPMVDRYVINNVCKQIKQWRENGFSPLSISINLSAKYLFEQQTISYIFEKIGEFDIQPGLLEIEVTEYGLIRDYKKTAINMMRLEQAGISIAIDDYGTGHANLETVLSLPIKHLKIDQSFIKLGMKTEKGKIVLENIFQLAHSLKVKTTAEGVETEPQLDYLKQSQCDSIQGYLLSKPLPVEEFEDYLT